jgi:hypothetical protein
MGHKWKGEDGSVDNPFYDWHYLGTYLQTPITPADMYSQTIGIIIPQSTIVGRGRIELPTQGFSVLCSTN